MEGQKANQAARENIPLPSVIFSFVAGEKNQRGRDFTKLESRILIYQGGWAAVSFFFIEGQQTKQPKQRMLMARGLPPNIWRRGIYTDNKSAIATLTRLLSEFRRSREGKNESRYNDLGSWVIT